MAKPTKQWIAFGDYLFKELKWGDDAVPIIMLCYDDDEMVKVLTEYMKANPGINADAVCDKAVELRKKKYGNNKNSSADDQH